MRLQLINLDKEAEKLKEITNPKILENGRFSKAGLFSQQIFGPIKSYSCMCGKLKGRKHNNIRCLDCGVKVTSSKLRRKTYATIKTPFPILNPLIYFMVIESKMSAKNILNNLLEYKAKYYFDSNGAITEVKNEEDLDSSVNVLKGLDGAVEYIRTIMEHRTDPMSLFIKKNFDQVTVNNVLVLPPSFRPCSKNSNGEYISDEINRLYTYILARVSHINHIPVDYSEDEIYRTNFKQLQKMVFELYKYIFDKLSKKKGLLRANILGKRVDFSGRAVISPNPDILLDECKIPYLMLLEIMKPQLTSYLVNRRLGKRYNAIVNLIDECIKNNDDKLFPYVEKFCRDKICILNRQPTLHRLSILGFKILPHLGKTLQIHPLVCPPYNADFDGDQMALYIPVTEGSCKDLKEKILIVNNLLSPANGEVVTQPNQDIVLGIYNITKNDAREEYLVPFSKTINGKVVTKMLPEGRVKFNECIPESYPVIFEYAITKKILSAILNRIAVKCGNVELMHTLDKMKVLGFASSTSEGFTLGISDLYNPKLFDIADNLTGKYKEDLDFIQNDPDFKDTLRSLPFSVYIDSGARGSWTQAQQLVFARGYVADHLNQIRPNLIQNSLVRGLTPKDYFESCWGSRKGLLDTALSTGDSGYLTRQLIYSAHFVELDGDDCGTEDYLDMNLEITDMVDGVRESNEVKTKQFFESLNGRYGKYYDTDTNSWSTLFNFNGSQKQYELLKEKRIKLRSPIYCKGDEICKKCYGETHTTVDSNQIGIIAAQTLGERLTQLVLRTFHLSGVVSGGGTKTGGNEDVISGMSIINQYFHKPLTIAKPDNPQKMVKDLFNLFVSYGIIYTVHFEVILSAMLWSGDDHWRTLADRDVKAREWVSILKVPVKKSWVIGVAFSNTKSRLLDGLVKGREDSKTAISSLFRF